MRSGSGIPSPMTTTTTAWSSIIRRATGCARAMGNKSVLFLANHGVIVTGGSVAEAFDTLYFLERTCHNQILAMSTGLPLKRVRDDVAEATASRIAEHDGIGRGPFHGAAAHAGPGGAGLLSLVRGFAAPVRRRCRYRTMQRTLAQRKRAVRRPPFPWSTMHMNRWFGVRTHPSNRLVVYSSQGHEAAP